jgi:hypothetical protein
MAALQGLKGLYPDPQDTTDLVDAGVLEAKANPIVSDHSQYGIQHLGYSGTVPLQTPYSGFPVYDGWSPVDSQQYGGTGFPEPGVEIERTPVTHASPYPRGILQQSWQNPDGLALAGDQLRDLHGQDLGGPKFYNGYSPTGREEVTHYTTDRYDAPNENYLATLTEEQLRQAGGHAQGGYGGGNADTTQGYGVLNTLPEFQMGHSIRRVQHDTVHFDHTNTHGEQGVPFYGRHPVEQMPLNGPDSPYFEQGNIDGANIVWEGRIGDPSPYVQSPEPALAPAPVSSSDVWAW